MPTQELAPELMRRVGYDLAPLVAAQQAPLTNAPTESPPHKLSPPGVPPLVMASQPGRYATAPWSCQLTNGWLRASGRAASQPRRSLGGARTRARPRSATEPTPAARSTASGGRRSRRLEARARPLQQAMRRSALAREAPRRAEPPRHWHSPSQAPVSVRVAAPCWATMQARERAWPRAAAVVVVALGLEPAWVPAQARVSMRCQQRAPAACRHRAGTRSCRR